MGDTEFSKVCRQESEKLERTEQIHRGPKYDEKGNNLGKELFSCDKCDYQCKK